MSRNKSHHEGENALVAEQWGKIPHHPLGEVPDDLPDENPILYRRIIAKRAIIAAYEDEIPQQCITDLLADLRHLCDALGLDFGTIDRAAYRAYARERVAAMHRKS